MVDCRIRFYVSFFQMEKFACIVFSVYDWAAALNISSVCSLLSGYEYLWTPQSHKRMYPTMTDGRVNLKKIMYGEYVVTKVGFDTVSRIIPPKFLKSPGVEYDTV